MPLVDLSDRDAKSGLRRSYRRLANRLSAGGTVLAYHGIRDAATFPDGGAMHVAGDRLAETVRALKRVTTVVPLVELLARRSRGRPTKGLSALTFDDAYASAGSAVEKLVAAESIPVTLFVVLDAARHGGSFWWDRIEGAFDGASPDRWRSFEDACGLPNAYREGQPEEMGRLRPFRQWMLAEHLGRWPATLERPLADLEAELGCRPSQRAMTFHELDGLLRNPLVDVGAHTLSHPVLPLLSDDELRHEIRSSFEELRSRYPRALPVLTPPFGLYDERTVRIGKEEGMTGCLTLQATALDDTASGDIIPRIGMMANCPPWKVVLFAMGCWRGVRPRRGAHPYPDLPSAST